MSKIYAVKETHYEGDNSFYDTDLFYTRETAEERLEDLGQSFIDGHLDGYDNVKLEDIVEITFDKEKGYLKCYYERRDHLLEAEIVEVECNEDEDEEEDEDE